MQPGFPDLSQIMFQAQQMQDDLQRAQVSLSETEVTGTAGGGLVSAVLGGDGELRAVQIDPSVIDPQDADTLGDLIVAAVRDAQRQVAELNSSTMSAVTGNLTDAFSGLGFGAAGIIDADDEDFDDDDDDDLDEDEDDLDLSRPLPPGPPTRGGADREPPHGEHTS